MKLNNEAEEVQDYSNIAANIVEEVKAETLAEILLKYPDRLQKNPDGTYSNYSGPSEAQDVYYFGEDGKTDGSTQYDALITINAKDYQYIRENKTGHGTTLMNDYAMPNIITVDSNKNGMFFSNLYKDVTTNAYENEDDTSNPNDKNLDQLAREYFLAVADEYADEQFRLNSAVYADYMQKLKAIQNGQALPTIPVEPQRETSGDPIYANPDYCQLDNILENTTRTIDIHIDDKEVSTGNFCTTINYQITFHYNKPTELNFKDTITYSIENKVYGSLINNIYLYYQASVYMKNDNIHRSNINISNNCGKAVNFYVVKQENLTLDPNIIPDPYISINQSGSDAVNIYTNRPDDRVKLIGVDETIDKVNNNIIVTSAPQNRIYSITVQICTHTEGTTETKYQEVLYTLNSNRQE